MKKLVLAMVFVLLMTLFIAFNYLLWDRESRENELKNLELSNASNSASISAQNREIKSLEDENDNQKALIGQLESTQEQLSQDKSNLEGEKAEINNTLAHKIEIINILKQNADLKVLDAPVRKWAEAIDTGNYAEAYDLEFGLIPVQNKTPNLNDYTNNLKNSVKSLKVKSTKVDPQGGNDSGEIYLEVTLEVKLNGDADASTSQYVDGLNDRYFKLDYNKDKNEFVITSISLKP